MASRIGWATARSPYYFSHGFDVAYDWTGAPGQIRLMQAGIRTKDLAFFIIFARFVLPVVLVRVSLAAAGPAARKRYPEIDASLRKRYEGFRKCAIDGADGWCDGRPASVVPASSTRAMFA